MHSIVNVPRNEFLVHYSPLRAHFILRLGTEAEMRSTDSSIRTIKAASSTNYKRYVRALTKRVAPMKLNERLATRLCTPRSPPELASLCVTTLSQWPLHFLHWSIKIVARRVHFLIFLKLFACRNHGLLFRIFFYWNITGRSTFDSVRRFFRS